MPGKLTEYDIAIHEAGHAVAAHVLRWKVDSISLVDDGVQQGRAITEACLQDQQDNLVRRGTCAFYCNDSTLEGAEDHVVMLVSGFTALKYFREYKNLESVIGDTAATRDFDKVEALLERYSIPRERFLKLLAFSSDIVKHPSSQKAIHVLADALVIRKCIPGDEARSMIKSALYPDCQWKQYKKPGWT